MTELRNGVYATPTEELSALALEARRRGISYGRLVANTTPYEQQEIIRDYCEEKARNRRRKKPQAVGMNCVLKYPGAKWGVASWVISFFPPHHSYLEPFFGSGGVFFNKSRSNIETINDLDGEVINLFECIKSDPERLARDIYFTPYARASYDKAFSKEIPKEPFDCAARLLIRCNMGHGFRTTGERVGWKNDVAGRERAYAAKAWTELPDIIVTAAERLRGVQIECSPAVELISRFNAPGVLVYCDPPYVLSTRRGKQYRCEMTDDDHLRLLDVLKRHKGPVLISGYKSPMYAAELRGWHREVVITTDQLSQQKEEILWMNFEPMGQMNLFDGVCHDDPLAIHQLVSGNFSKADVKKTNWVMPAGAFHGAAGGPC